MGAPLSAETEAGRKLARRILSEFWDSFLVIFGATLRSSSGGDLAGTEPGAATSATQRYTDYGFGDSHALYSYYSFRLTSLLSGDGGKLAAKREAVTDSLESLQLSAKLCIQLGLQSRCGHVFQLLASASCPAMSSDSVEVNDTRGKRSTRSKSTPLHVSHILSMEVLLSSALEVNKL